MLVTIETTYLTRTLSISCAKSTKKKQYNYPANIFYDPDPIFFSLCLIAKFW